MKREELIEMPIQRLYELARKKGIRHDDSMSKEDLIEQITGFEEEGEYKSPETNPYSAKNPDSAPEGEENTIEED